MTISATSMRRRDLVSLRLAAAMALAACGLPACGDSGGSTGDEPGSAGALADGIADAVDGGGAGVEVEGEGPLEGWPESVTTLGLISQSVGGDLSDGAPVDLAWGGQPTADCWIGTDPAQLRGAHVMYGLKNALPKTDEVVVTVTPAAGVDVNLFAVAFEVQTYYVPPDVPYAIDCKRSWDAAAGEPETVTLRNISAPLEWLIVVAGPEAVEAGAYEISLLVQ